MNFTISSLFFLRFIFFRSMVKKFASFDEIRIFCVHVDHFIQLPESFISFSPKNLAIHFCIFRRTSIDFDSEKINEIAKG